MGTGLTVFLPTQKRWSNRISRKRPRHADLLPAIERTHRLPLSRYHLPLYDRCR